MSTYSGNYVMEINEGQRQTLIMALAHTAVEQPGWDFALAAIVAAIRPNVPASPEFKAQALAENANIYETFKRWAIHRLAEEDPFHAHLEVCERCAAQPFNLCPIGAAALTLAATIAAARTRKRNAESATIPHVEELNRPGNVGCICLECITKRRGYHPSEL